jgi:hypothetical protein
MRCHIDGLKISRKKLQNLFELLERDEYITKKFIITEKLKKDL